MSVMISDDKKELVVTCKCGCQDTIHVKIDNEDKEADYYAIMTYLNGNWYRDQDDSIFRCIGRKLKKIWAIIRNKDYYYSDVLMSCEDFRRFKEYVNQFLTGKEYVITGNFIYQLMRNVNAISEASNRIDNNCEEKEQTNEYRMYDDIQKINNSIIEIMNILSGGKS